jgi:hypothetical protein
MAVTVATPPDQSLQVLTATVQNWMTHLTSAPHTENTGISFAGPDGIHVHLPHRVYTMSLTDLAQGRTLAAASPVAWRYVLTDGDSAAIAEIAQMPQPNGTQIPAFSMINRGPFVASLIQTVDAVAKNSTVVTSNFEVAVIHIPALYVMALWLQARAPGGGSVVPLAPAPGVLNAGQSYTEHAFIQALVPMAQRSLQQGGSARA